MSGPTNGETAGALAREVLSIGRGRLAVRFRFLHRALFALTPEPDEEIPLGTDGRVLRYQPRFVLCAFRRDPHFAVRLWLHMVLHAVFQHMFVDPAIDRTLWNAACDLAVESIASGLRLREGLSEEDVERERVLAQLSVPVRPMTAERLYRHLLVHTPDAQTLRAWQRLFAVDSHDLWYVREQERDPLTPAAEVRTGALQEVSGAMELTAPGDDAGAQAASLILRGVWQEISRGVLNDLESVSKEQGASCGQLVQALRLLHREKADYATFLRQFAVSCEVMRISPDEFDLIAYTYGLALYGDTPLIEPLETREDARIRDFVIAIDTSGSVRGELVQKFVQKTFTVLRQSGTYDARLRLHLIQCDAGIRGEVVLTSPQEVEDCLARLVLRGFGGTDFRPVFARVDALRRQGALPQLRGLIYFTDGFGAFPERPPDYRAAFVFVDDGGLNPRDLPAWAIRLRMTEDELDAL